MPFYPEKQKEKIMGLKGVREEVKKLQTFPGKP